MVGGPDSAWRNRAPGPHRNTARQAMDSLWTEVCGQQRQQKRPRQQPAYPQYANYWAPLARKRHTMPHSAQSQHANYWAPRTRKRHQQEHRPQRPTERSDPTQHAKGRTGDRPGPRKGATTRRNVTQGGCATPAVSEGEMETNFAAHGTHLRRRYYCGPHAATLCNKQGNGGGGRAGKPRGRPPPPSLPRRRCPALLHPVTHMCWGTPTQAYIRPADNRRRTPPPPRQLLEKPNLPLGKSCLAIRYTNFRAPDPPPLSSNVSLPRPPDGNPPPPAHPKIQC